VPARDDGPFTIRALTLDDTAAWNAAWELLDAIAVETPVDLARYHVELCARGENDDTLAAGAFAHEQLCGLVIYALVAGAVGTGRCIFVGVAAEHRRHGVGRALIDAALADLARRGARFVFVELPGSMLAAGALLERLGFSEETRVGGYFADGVDLRFLRLALPAP
jgi:ribosomal protein S18 acetylase RimI-like enzyme